MNEELAKAIEEQALAHSFSACGIISLEDLEAFAESFEKRLRDVPESSPFYERLRPLTRVRERFPWAKSIVVCTTGYRKYQYPEALQHKFAKAFVLSRDSDPAMTKEKAGFTEWLTAQGIRWARKDEQAHLQVGSLRFAAMMAGLGIIRKNNFFYDENGSFVDLDGYAIDAECRLYHHKKFHPCSEKCHFCQDACPTHALQGPHAMNPLRCVSFCNTFGGGHYPDDVTDAQLGTWTIGCDACQDACPFNRAKNWDEGEAFPHLAEAAPAFELEHLAEASDEDIIAQIIPWTARHIQPAQTELVRQSARRALKNEQRAAMSCAPPVRTCV